MPEMVSVRYLCHLSRHGIGAEELPEKLTSGPLLVKFFLRADKMGHIFTHPPAERAGSEIHPSGDVGVRPLAVEGTGESYVEPFEDRPGSSGACFASGHSEEARE